MITECHPKSDRKWWQFWKPKYLHEPWENSVELMYAAGHVLAGIPSKKRPGYYFNYCVICKAYDWQRKIEN